MRHYPECHRARTRGEKQYSDFILYLEKGGKSDDPAPCKGPQEAPTSLVKGRICWLVLHAQDLAERQVGVGVAVWKQLAVLHGCELFSHLHDAGGMGV